MNKRAHTQITRKQAPRPVEQPLATPVSVLFGSDAGLENKGPDVEGSIMQDRKIYNQSLSGVDKNAKNILSIAVLYYLMLQCTDYI